MESVQDGNEAVFEKLEILTDEISLPSFHLYPLSVSVFASIPYLSLFSSLSPICLCFRLNPLSVSVFASLPYLSLFSSIIVSMLHGNLMFSVSPFEANVQNLQIADFIIPLRSIL